MTDRIADHVALREAHEAETERADIRTLKWTVQKLKQASPQVLAS